MGLFSGLGSIINPVGAMNSAIFGNSFSGKYQQDDANAMAMQAWNLANDYNHPINQMNRLKAAGLNPNLVYGSGSVAGNTTGAPSLVGGGISTGLETMYNAASKTLGVLQGNANLASTQAQARASNAAAVSSGAQAANLNAQTAINEQKANYEEKALIADIDYKKALARKTNAEADITQGEADLFGTTGGAKGAQALGKGASTVLRIGRGIFGGK